MKRPSLAQQTEAVHEWNALHSTGQQVSVKLDDGTTGQTVTKSPAWLLGGHTAVVLLGGMSGAYALERVTAV